MTRRHDIAGLTVTPYYDKAVMGGEFGARRPYLLFQA